MTALFIAPRVPISDPASGLCNPIWYRFFSDLFGSLGGGGGSVPDIEGAFLLPYGSSISDEMLVRVGAVSDDFNEGGLLPPLSDDGVFTLSFGTTGLTPAVASKGQITVAGNLVVSHGGTGATSLTGYVKGNGTAAFTASATIPAADVVGVALTKVDDTNVTLTLGGSPATALVAATSLTLGWTGQLAVARGGTGVSTSTGSTAVVLSNLPQFTSTIGVGTAASASGSGVSFPATQSASTDPNTLDDYKEGTYTTTVTPGSGTITTLGAITGSYTKIGRQVTVTVGINITTNGTGAGRIDASLPFTSKATDVFVGVGKESNLTGDILSGTVLPSATVMNIVKTGNVYPGANGARLDVTVTYFV